MSTNRKLSCKTFDARGNGNGEISCTITGNHQSFISDYTAIALQTFRKTSHPHSIEIAQGWEETNINDTLNVFDNSETRTPTLITQVKNMKRVYDWHRQDTRMKELGDVCVTAAAGWGGRWKQYAVCTGGRYGNSGKKINTFRMREITRIS